jgi:hypothetical protein
MKTIFPKIFLLITTIGFSQQSEFRMKIRATQDKTGKRFELRVNKTKQEVQFHFAQYDSTSSKWDTKDKYLYNKLIKNFYKNGGMPYEHTRIIEGINRKYEYYKKDSISIPLNHPFIYVTDSIVLSTSERLKNFEVNKKTQMKSGSQVTLNIFSNDTLRTVSVRSPTFKSHPLIYKLLTGMLEIYRNRNPKILLTEKETFGY